MATTLRVFFAEHTIFTSDEFKAYLHSKGTTNSHTQAASLNYHLKQGHIVRIKRGLFASVSPLFEPVTMPIDPFVLAAKLAPDAILSHHTALELHGVAYSSYHVFTFLTQVGLKSFEFRGHTFKVIKPPKLLRAEEQEKVACEQQKRQGIVLTLTSLERTFVDVIDKPNLAGGWEEILLSFEMIAVMDIELLLQYTLLLNKVSLTSKVGYFLEYYQKIWGVSETQLKRLEQQASKSKIYLERTVRESGKLISRWNLVVPNAIIERIWDELS